MIVKRVSAVFVGKTVLVSAVLALVACGGGGGGGGGGGSTASSSSGGTTGGIANYAAGGSLSLYSGSLGGYGYADGAGGAARFDEIQGLARDGAGNLYVADRSIVRKVTLAGVVSTLALTGSTGHVDAGTGSPRFNWLGGIALNSSGTLYVSDAGDHTIYKITSGSVTTLAGSNALSGSLDAMGVAARFNSPRGLAVDSYDNVFVADYTNHTIRKITSAGAVSTPAGSAGISGSNDGSGVSARFNYPSALAVDASNNIYVGDTNGVRKLSPAGAVSTVASLSAMAGAGCAGSVSALSIDTGGNLYVSANARVCKISSGGLISFVAGSGSLESADGIGASAGLVGKSMVINSTGDTLYVGDRIVLRKLVPATGSVTTLAGKLRNYAYLDGAVASAQYSGPWGIAADSSGNLIVVDYFNYVIRKISGGVVSTLAGSAGNSGSTDGTGAAARFSILEGVATDKSGNVYVLANAAVRKITAAGEVTTLAGSAGNSGSADGTGSAARFSYARGLTVDAAGNVYVADTGSHTIRKITPAGVVSTLAGLAYNWGSANGTGTAARFNVPSGITIDSAGNLYVADGSNNAIRKITPAGVVTTLTGTSSASGYVDGPIASARFQSPYAISIDSADNLYVTDGWYTVVRKISTAGQVTTVVGTSDGREVVATGSLPGHLNTPRGIAVIGKKLYITDENAVLVADIP